MKTFAINGNNQIVELSFSSEEDIETAFNAILGSGVPLGEITDSTGKTVAIDTSYGYSNNPGDFASIQSKSISSATTFNFE